MKPTLAVVLLASVVASCASRRNTSDAQPPLACSLSPENLKARGDQLLPGLIRRAEKVEDLENGLRLRFTSKPGLLAEITRIIDQERTCCSFLRFQVTAEPETGPVVFDVTGPPGTREVLRSL